MTTRLWNTNDIPNQIRRVAVVTGASSGLGLEVTRALAHKGATVVMAVRDVAKGEQAADTIFAEKSDAKIRVAKIDLCSLDSIKKFYQQFLNHHDRLDLLINNAGVMMTPYSTTEDGFEVQMGTNHFGHFALTGHLLDRLKSTPGSRVVQVSSIAHRAGNLNFDDIQWKSRRYNTIRAYADSKLANLHFTYEFARRLGDQTAPRIIAAHPGVSRTELTGHVKIIEFMGKFVAQSQERGALPILRSGIDPAANNGDYYGPSGFLEMSGSPIRVKSSKWSKNEDPGGRLWAISEKLTGVKY